MSGSRMLGCLLVLVCAGPAVADETPIQSTIQSIGLFKNGLAVVRRTLTVPGAGTYRIEDVPTPVHGTFFIESAATVTATVTMREFDVSADDVAGANLQGDLAGRLVTIHFRDGSIPPVTGTVASLGRRTAIAADPPPSSGTLYGTSGGLIANYDSDRLPAPTRFLVLQTANGRAYVDPSMIAHMAVDGAPGIVKRSRPVLLLTVDSTRSDRVPITLLYLTRGIGWAPSYRVDLADGNALRIEQEALVKNELQDFADVDLQLISGFPSIQFAHVTSPLSTSTSWTTFFQQLNQRIAPANNAGAATQLIIANSSNRAETGADLSAIPTDEGVDVHYHSIGRRTMNRGDALALVVAKAETVYERIIEWTVPDTRTADGRPVLSNDRLPDSEAQQNAAWDAVRFKNPLPFAMTTGPATITTGARFNAQSTSGFVNAGEQTLLTITKALSIRTRAVEEEMQGPRELVRVGGRDYRKIAVKGELAVDNHRAENVTVLIRRQFSGDLVRADADPKLVLREEGASFLNRRNELAWTIVLKPGESRTLSYQYSVLAAN
jgi:hypothetical protein